MNQYDPSTGNYYVYEPWLENNQAWNPILCYNSYQFIGFNVAETFFNDQPTFCYFNLCQTRLTEESNRSDVEVSRQSQVFCKKKLRKRKYKNEHGKQKQGRNVISNIFRSFLKYANSKDFFQGDFNKLTNSISQKQFCEKLKQFSDFQNYIKKTQIIQFVIKTTQNEENQQFSRLIRSLLFDYIRNVHVKTIYNSRKIASNFRNLHFKKLRSFEKFIRKFYNEGKQNRKYLDFPLF